MLLLVDTETMRFCAHVRTGFISTWRIFEPSTADLSPDPSWCNMAEYFLLPPPFVCETRHVPDGFVELSCHSASWVFQLLQRGSCWAHIRRLCSEHRVCHGKQIATHSQHTQLHRRLPLHPSQDYHVGAHQLEWGQGLLLYGTAVP
jgi:hypothetical protein